MESLKSWEPCLADQHVDLAFFDGIRIDTDRITEPRWDRVLPILEEEQVFMCRMMANVLKSRPGARVLDIGTGSGVFAIYAAKLGCRVVAIDISSRALRFARENARSNKVPMTSTEPHPGEIQFILCSYEKMIGDDTFDIVILAPPYNPTCPGFRPALHADAGELGEDCFNKQLPAAAHLVKPDGVCIGNQMLVVNNAGEFEVTAKLQESFPGGSFDFFRILPEDISVEYFLREQYATYLKPQLGLKPLAREVEGYINKHANGSSFALVYFELMPRNTIKIAESNIPININEHLISNRPPKTWIDRISLHRHIIEHTSLDHSFPAPALFLDIDALPDFPEAIDDHVSNEAKWKNSVLRYIDTWLNKTELLDKDKGTLDVLIIDTAPWYPSPEGRKALSQEAAVWVNPKCNNDELANRLLSLYQDNTNRLLNTHIGPFLHRHFTGRNKIREWRSVQFTVNEPSLEENIENCDNENALISRLLTAIEDSPQYYPTNKIINPKNDIGDNYIAFIQENLKELGVTSSKLKNHDEQARSRIEDLKNLCPVLKNKKMEDLYPVDLDLCHRVMHRRLDILANRAGISEIGTSFMIGIPVSIAIPTSKSNEFTLPDNYRGGIWVYAISSDFWKPESERYLLDLSRLLSLLYEAQYSELAANELRRIGFDSAQFNWAHETKHVIQAMRNWPKKPKDFGFEKHDANDDDYAIVPFHSLFEAGFAHLQVWTMAGSVSDLPFYNGTEKSLPTNISDLIHKSFLCTSDTFLLRLFRVYEIEPSEIDLLSKLLNALRNSFPTIDINVFGSHEIDINWEDNTSIFWVNFSRLLLCEFREALQHCDWTKNIVIEIYVSEGQLSRIIFKNFTLSKGDFKKNLMNVPPPLPRLMEIRDIELAFTSPVVRTGDLSGRKGDGTQERQDIASRLNAKVSFTDIIAGKFQVEYQFGAR